MLFLFSCALSYHITREIPLLCRSRKIWWHHGGIDEWDEVGLSEEIINLYTVDQCIESLNLLDEEIEYSYSFPYNSVPLKLP